MGYVWTREQVTKVFRLRAAGEVNEKGLERATDSEEFLNAAANQLRKKFIEEARTSAVEVSPQDVVVEWDGDNPDQGTVGDVEEGGERLQMQHAIARWKPHRPVRIEGGPADGQIIQTPRSIFEPGELRIPTPALPDDEIVEVRYTIGGWDEDERVWVYVPVEVPDE